MNNLTTLIKKEWSENLRNYKILWIPLVFIIFGIIEPLTNRYLPEIMQQVGNMPEGTDFPWPEFTGSDILISLMGQYQTIGLLIIILGFMGAISNERKNGTAALIYVRPIRFGDYFLSKWIMVNAIVLTSVWLGFIASWYYIQILFDKVAIQDLFVFLATYSLWIIFVVTIVITLSAWVSTGMTAAIGILIVIIGSVVDSVVGQFWMITPWKLPTYAMSLLNGKVDLADLWMTIGLTVVLIIGLVLFGINMAKRNAAKTTV